MCLERKGQLLKAIIAATLLLTASVQAKSFDPFKTTDEYVRSCSTTKLSDGCYQGYEGALMEFVLGKNTAEICVPSQSGTASNNAAYVAAENVEIHRLVAWLKEHQQPMHQMYRQGLGSAIVALYGCK